MSGLDPIREIIPVARPTDAEVIVRQWIERYAAPRHEDSPSRLWTDHFASVDDFRRWKVTHPNDGTMTKIYHWAPYILATVSVVTFSPMLLGAAAGMLIMRRPPR